MGGKKKRSIRQMAKASKRKTGTKEKRVGAVTSERKSVPGITLPRLEGDDVASQLKMKAITPYSVASRFELRLSVAKSFLKELERRGVIKLVSKSRGLKVYRPAD